MPSTHQLLCGLSIDRPFVRDASNHRAPASYTSAQGATAGGAKFRCPRCMSSTCWCEVGRNLKSTGEAPSLSLRRSQFSKSNVEATGPSYPAAVEAKERCAARPARVVYATVTVARRRNGAIAGPVAIHAHAGQRCKRGASPPVGAAGPLVTTPPRLRGGLAHFLSE